MHGNQRHGAYTPPGSIRVARPAGRVEPFPARHRVFLFRGQRWWILLVGEALGYLKDITLWIGQPDAAPGGNKRIEAQRPEGHSRLTTHGGELCIDVVHAERDIANTGIKQALAAGVR